MAYEINVANISTPIMDNAEIMILFEKYVEKWPVSQALIKLSKCHTSGRARTPCVINSPFVLKERVSRKNSGRTVKMLEKIRKTYANRVFIFFIFSSLIPSQAQKDPGYY
jgi:hypothetical protein